MKRAAVLLMVFFLGGCSIPFIGTNKSGLKIVATPPATVVLDGKQIGQTPFEQLDLKPKPYKLQLIPQSGQPWETTVTTRSNLQAVVERIFGQTDQESEGYVMELELTGEKSQSQINIVTIPDPATVRIDGQPKGFAPISTTLTSEGNHEVTVSSAGYAEKRIPVSVPRGYRLQLSVQLARARLLEPTPEASPSAESSNELTPTPTSGKSKTTPTPTPKSKLTPTLAATPDRPYVEILDTPTGWLRVRKEPNTSAAEITKVNPKETYKFIEANETGWYKIELPDGQEGWISGQYAKLYR